MTMTYSETRVQMFHRQVTTAMPPLTNEQVADLMRIVSTRYDWRAVETACGLLIRHAATHQRLAENECNGYQDWKGNWDEKAEKRAERKNELLEARIAAIAAALGGRADFQGDPRGWTVRIVFPCHQQWNDPQNFGPVSDAIGVPPGTKGNN